MFLTLAGAMSTAELGLSLAEMIRQDKVHAITCTGANLEEDVFNLVAHDHYERIPDWRQLSPEGGKPRGWLILSAIFTGLALGTKYYAGIGAAAFVLQWAMDERPPDRRRGALVSGAPAAYAVRRRVAGTAAPQARHAPMASRTSRWSCMGSRNFRRQS